VKLGSVKDVVESGHTLVCGMSWHLPGGTKRPQNFIWDSWPLE